MKRILGPGLLAAGLVIALVIIAGCGSSGSTGGTGNSGGTDGSSADGASVTMENFAFSPQSVEINAGESVTWTNKDSATHDVEGDGGMSSGNMAQDATYTKQFDTAGTYYYKCSIHPSMTGTVVVK